jgi:hypothetical protein
MLLEAPVSMREARLDPRAAFLLERLRSIELGLAACPEAQLPSHLSSDLDEAVEQIAELLLATQGVKAQGLCLALARLLEETPRLATRHSQSLGVGFEALKDSRWKARLEILQLGREALRHPRFSERRFLELAKQPESFYKALHSSLPGVDHSAIERWVELERRVRMLRFVRRDKTDGQGNIRFLLARLASGEVVLTSLGLKGAWRVPCGSSAGRTNRALRALYESPSALESRPESLARWLSTFPQSGLTLEQALRCALGRGGRLSRCSNGLTRGC